jgi:hypothetical protein
VARVQGDIINITEALYPFIFIVLMSEFTHKLNSKGDKQSPCSTPRSIDIGAVMKFFVKIEIP